MRQKEKFQKFVERFKYHDRFDLIFRVYCLERYIERLNRVFKDVQCIDDTESADFMRYIKGGKYE